MWRAISHFNTTVTHIQQPLQPQNYVQEHCPGETGQQCGIIPIDSLAFLKVVNEHNALSFASQKTEVITFLADNTTLAFFMGEKVGASTA